MTKQEIEQLFEKALLEVHGGGNGRRVIEGLKNAMLLASDPSFTPVPPTEDLQVSIKDNSDWKPSDELRIVFLDALQGEPMDKSSVGILQEAVGKVLDKYLH